MKKAMNKSTFLTVRSIKDREYGLFCHQMALMVQSGLMFPEIFRLLSHQQKNRSFRKDCNIIADLIQNGQNLSVAAATLPQSFPPLMVAVFGAAQKGGGMVSLLNHLGDYYDEQDKLKSEVLQAFAYPLIVVGVALCTIIFLMTVVVPTFISVLESMSAEIPLITRIFLGIGNALAVGWPLLVLIPVGLWLLWLIGRKHPGFELSWSRFVLALPGYGKMQRYLETIRLTKMMGLLLGNGVELLSIVEATEAVAGQAVFKNALRMVRENLTQGKALATSFEQTGCFPEDFCQMLRVGETTGTLEAVLGYIGNYNQTLFTEWRKRLVTILEPALLIGVALIVLVVVLSVMMPVYDIYTEYGTMI